MPQLKVMVKREGRVCVLSVSGELDIATAPALAGRAASAMQVPAERLVLDLSGLEFIDCCGVQALAAVTRAAPPNCPVLVRGASNQVRKVLGILAVPLERHGAVDLDQTAWLILESQVQPSLSEQVRADTRNQVTRSHRGRLRREGISGHAGLPAALRIRLAGRGPDHRQGC